MIGKTIAHYKILGKLGAGGMGEVFLAEDTRLQRKVALKFLPQSLAATPESRARFEREARAQASINNPHVVTLHDVGEVDGSPYIAMECVEGQSLGDYCRHSNPSLSQMLELAQQVVDGLDAAHQKGVVHRDLKPSNILISANGTAKICDFGLAHARAGEQLTQTGSTLGTASYMSPEQAQGKEVDHRSDLYSLGAVLYEMISGKTPFPGEHMAAIVYSIVNEQPKPLAADRESVPEALEKAIFKLLQKDADARYQTARDLNVELKMIRQSLEAPQHALSTDSEEDEPPSIAVLPFANMSPDPENEYFSDGLTEELMNYLAKVRGLRVAARTSSFQFKGETADIGSIGQQLKVNSVLEGSVRKAGNRVRITAQLINVADGYHLWSETYNRELDDIFEVQEDIAQAVVKELKDKLLGEEISGPVMLVDDPKVYDLCLRGRYLRHGGNKSDLIAAIGYLEEALAIAPRSALALAELGHAHVRFSGRGYAPYAEGFTKARELVERALAIDGNSVAANLLLGEIHTWYDWDWDGAEAALRRALELDPNNSEVASSLARVTISQGNATEALELMERAVRSDPLSAVAHRLAGTLAWIMGRFAAAEDSMKRAVELRPNGPAVNAMLAVAQMFLGRLEEALNQSQRETDELFRLTMTAVICHDMGRTDDSSEALEKAIKGHGERGAYQIAAVYAYRGELDRAFEWLGIGYGQRDSGLVYVNTDRFMRNLYDDPRWPVFLKKMNMKQLSLD